MNNGHFNNGMYFNNQSQPHNVMRQQQAMYGYNQQPPPHQQQMRKSAPMNNLSMHLPHVQQQQSQMQQPRRHSMPPSNQYQMNKANGNIQKRQQHHQQQQSPSPNIVNMNIQQQTHTFDIRNSIEHQQCIQFLKSRNFSHNATQEQRMEILTKIGNALSNKYTHNELQRRSLILRQSASHILESTKPPPIQKPPPQNLMDDLISTPVSTVNTTTNSTKTNSVAVAAEDFSDFNDPFDGNDNVNNAEDDDEWGDFGDANGNSSNPTNPAKPAVIDLLGPLVDENTELTENTQNDISDPLDLINNDDANKDVDDFAKFVGGIKAKPSIEAYMMAAFAGNKLDSVGKSKKKMSEIAPSNQSDTNSMHSDTCIFDEVKEVPKAKAPPKAKALPDIFNQIIEEKLNADDFGDGFDDFTGAENDGKMGDENEEESKNVEKEVADVLDLPMDVFLSEAGNANKEYDKKMAERLEQENKKKEESEAERQQREQLALMEKLKNKPPDPFLNLFGPQIIKKEEKKKAVVADDDDWGDFDGENNVQNAEDDFFNAPFDDDDDIGNDKNMKKTDVKVDVGGQDKEDEIDWNEFDKAEDISVETKKKAKKNKKTESVVKKEEESFDVDFDAFGAGTDDKSEKKDNKKKSKEQRRKERRERRKQRKEKEKREKEKNNSKQIVNAGQSIDDSFDIDFGGFEEATPQKKDKQKKEKKEKSKEINVNVVDEPFEIDFDNFDDGKKEKNEKKNKNKKSKKKEKKKEKKNEDMDLSFNGFDDSITKSADTNNVFDEIKPQKTPTPVSPQNTITHVEENEIDFDGFSEWSESKKDDKETAKIEHTKSISLKVEDEDDWDARYEQSQKRKEDNDKVKSPTLEVNDNDNNADDDSWGDFDQANDATQQNITSDQDNNQNDDNNDDDWGDFGDDDNETNDNAGNNLKSEPSVTMSMSKDILPSFPLDDDDAEDQGYDNLNVPTEKDWKRSKSIQSVQSMQNEESLSDFKNFGPEISANKHESLDLDFEDEEEVENELNEHDKSLSSVIEETNEINDELNPFENPFAAIINDADDDNFTNSNEDNPFADNDNDNDEEEQSEVIDEDPFGDMDADDDEDMNKAEAVTANINPFEPQMDERQIIEAIDAEQYEKALLLFDLQQKHTNLDKNRYDSQVLEAQIAKNKQLDILEDDDDDERQLAKQQNLQKLMDLEKDKMRIRAEIKAIDRSIDQFNLSSMDILPYSELYQISKTNDKLSQFSEFFGKRFDEYLPSKKPYKINEDLCDILKIIISQQKRAHFFINAVSNRKSVKNDIKLYEQFLCLAQITFEDANERLIKLKENLQMCEDEYFAKQSHKQMFDSFASHFDHLLILYKMCKSVGNGLDLINKVFEDEEIMKTWNIIDNVFNSSIVCLRNEIIKKWMNDENKRWNLTQFNQNNELLPNKEQISQIVMHLNGI